MPTQPGLSPLLPTFPPFHRTLPPGGITPAQASNPLAGGAASRPYYAAGLYGEGEIIGVGGLKLDEWRVLLPTLLVQLGCEAQIGVEQYLPMLKLYFIS